MKPLRYYHIGRLLFPIFILLSSCKKFVEVAPPKTQIIGSAVFSNDATATSAMVGIYSKLMSNSSSFINTQITRLGGLSSDELVNFSTSVNDATVFQNALDPGNSNVLILWRDTYGYIYQANAVIEGLINSTGVTSGTKNQLTGEAKFIRALCHFYLVNFFGDVPYITTTDYRANTTVSRTPKAQVYQQIIADLKDAQSLLNDAYVKSDNTVYTISAERIRPNKWAATSLLARVYLYVGDWMNAETQASAIINNSTVYNLTGDLNSVFLKNSNEAIWQLMPVTTGINTPEGSAFILATAPTSTAISDQLLNSFEAGDNRKSKWINSISVGTQTYYYPYKYKVKTGALVTEYYMVFRLAEQILIRSEARARQNNILGAISDLNLIRLRAGLSGSINTLTQAQTLTAIDQERRVELFLELGNRWLDLKRTNNADAILGPLKSPNWQSTDVLYPIPLAQLQNDPNMTQNAGY
jgi:hypothetical protein